MTRDVIRGSRESNTDSLGKGREIGPLGSVGERQERKRGPTHTRSGRGKAQMMWLAASVQNWWDEMNDSAKWQDGVFYFLSAAYSLVSAVALIQVVRIQLRVPEYVRAVVFGFHKNVFLFRPRVFTLVLLDLPGILFFSTYTLLVLFWAEIYYQARSLPSDKLRIVYIIVNCGIYVIQVCIWIYLWIHDNRIVESIGSIFVAVLSFIAAVGFILYGGRLFCMLRRFPIESKGRQKKLHEVGSVAAICFTCFLVRCCVVGSSAFDTDMSLDVLNHPILDLIYYTLAEILPAALVLYVLRKLPPRRVSGQNSPLSGQDINYKSICPTVRSNLLHGILVIFINEVNQGLR
ncbi:Tobamovirus multiplication protein [Musa troglodytarum]|uniref:Tobamovirus multiplication protein n=1 Tax=Musa troglodytarum TaxID=320322 RepID=A0A9E7HVC4_9LILI|nr:Tobamovirus multiplication protein [Musa troglodytarum]